MDVDRPDLDDVSTLVSSAKSGITSVYLGDTVRIGAFNIAESYQVLHASHSSCTSQVVLTAKEHDTRYDLRYIDLPLEALSGPLLQTVAVNTKRMQNLVAYISLIVRCIQSDFSSNLQLPNKLINNISEELSEKQEGSLVNNLYHLAMTGAFTPTMLEWLADTVKDSTHKRWDKAINDMYTQIQMHIFMHLIPALDRLAIATDAIRGHALFHEDTGKFVPSKPITALMDDIDSIRCLGQRLQLIVMTEHRQFRAFSKWMRVMIDIGVAGPGSKPAAEIEERDLPNQDDASVLAYIQKTLIRSRLAQHLEQKDSTNGKQGGSKDVDYTEPAEEHRRRVMKAIQDLNNLREADESQTDALLILPALTARLIASTRQAISSISNWQSGMLSEPSTISLRGTVDTYLNTTVLDLKLFPRGQKPHSIDSITYIVMKSSGGENGDTMRFVKCSRHQRKETEVTRRDLIPPKGQILHARILNEERCLVLLESAREHTHILISCDLSANNAQDARNKPIHDFSGQTGFTPSYFLVGGRRGKMVCVVFGNDGRGWKVFDLSEDTNAMKIADDDDNEEEMIM